MRESEVATNMKGKQLAKHIISTMMDKNAEAAQWPAKCEKVNTRKPGPRLMWQILTDPYQYLHSKPGKDIRAQMIASFNMWLQVPELALNIITQVVEMLHTSSLL
jgi:geranylgeranyl pyrophosphate synthase